ncbi:MAG: hypothetical protein H0T60_03685 [Acidobacteria bacterium]|nr:hypothetical protein [Acidobacteriota bacterium]
MRIKCVGLLFLLIFPSSAFASASPCGKSGMTVLRANDGGGFIFYVFREGPDFAFELPGKETSFPDGLSGPRRFLIDGIHFESLLVKPSAFMKSEKGVADLEILKKHQAYEFEFMQKTPTPLRQLIELGPREKPAANGQPSFTFYLWEAADPRDPKGARQYFLSTVSGGEVTVLSAIVPNQAKEGEAMRAFNSYASSFQHVLKKEQCPEKASK